MGYEKDMGKSGEKTEARYEKKPGKKPEEGFEEGCYYLTPSQTRHFVRQGGLASLLGKQQGEFTVEDLEHLPNGVSAELVDGVIHYMTVPSTLHQAVGGELYFQISSFLRRRRGDCKVFIPSFGVRPDDSGKTFFVPDLTVICDKHKIRKDGCHGAPDLIVEILSPSTRRWDLGTKTRKYREIGVRELWIVDLSRRSVAVRRSETWDMPVLYGYSAKIPVGIWDGELEIDFAEISEQVAYLEDSEESRVKI